LTRKLRIGDWTLTPELNKLECGKETVRVEPKIIQVLLLLATQPGAVFSKEHILRKVWPDTFVSEEVLTRSVSELRKVFKDNPKAPRYIETIPKGGYRLLAPVVPADAAPEDNLRDIPGKKVKIIAGLGASALLLAIIAFYFLNPRRHKPASPSIHSLVVLPLTNLSGDPAEDYFADALTDELTTVLAGIGELRVVSRTSAIHYKDTRMTAPEIARELGVDALVEGSILRSGERIRITAQLITAPTDRHIWAETYDRDMRDIIALQNDLARNIARHVEISLTPDERRHLAHAPAVDSRAYQFYLKGRYFWSKRTEYEKAIDNFQHSLESDPSFAPAYSGLADSYLTKIVNEGHANEWITRARAAADKATELDPALPEAHISLALISTLYDWDWAAAEREFKRAIELSPNSAGSHQHFALFLALRRRPSEAKYETQRAEELDPTAPYVFNTSARVFYYGRDYDAAERAAKRALEFDSEYALAHAILSYVYFQKGMIAQAFAHYQSNMILWGTRQDEVQRIQRGFQASGMRGVWQEALRRDLQACRSNDCIPDDVAMDYALLGKNQESLAWWSKACDQKSLWVLDLAVNPALDHLHSYKEYDALAQRIGLPE
jgi:TolB-like protein/DNA-binding winged helix-turn-helix (wHTH) protein/Tfp pilus assembly protein PilF